MLKHDLHIQRKILEDIQNYLFLVFIFSITLIKTIRLAECSNFEGSLMFGLSIMTCIALQNPRYRSKSDISISPQTTTTDGGIIELGELGTYHLDERTSNSPKIKSEDFFRPLIHTEDSPNIVIYGRAFEHLREYHKKKDSELPLTFNTLYDKVQFEKTIYKNFSLGNDNKNIDTTSADIQTPEEDEILLSGFLEWILSTLENS